MPHWLEVGLRTLLALVVLFIITKALGKRQISQLSLFEYITGISIGNIAGYISIDTDTEWYVGILSLAVWAAVSVGAEKLTVHSKKARDLIDGKAAVLIEKGNVVEKNLAKERLTVDELLGVLRDNSVFRLADVEFALMEPSGKVNVMLKSEKQPLVREDIGMQPAENLPAQTVIIDNKIMEKPLRDSGYNEQWLRKELHRMRIKYEDVFMAQIDDQGELLVDLYDPEDEGKKK
ncbi:DUF421 domain-containing protein [Paenibacillus daejeonensis]|uniref:DUF421 domain-containing protein n=1 Tax=Paenibacillus daejeonensis TaxID=135193 RepID=UPI000382C9EF|nr:DUF421 domain-containing protein [Paenibacillus daejeonensis]